MCLSVLSLNNCSVCTAAFSTSIFQFACVAESHYHPWCLPCIDKLMVFNCPCDYLDNENDIGYRFGVHGLLSIRSLMYILLHLFRFHLKKYSLHILTLNCMTMLHDFSIFSVGQQSAAMETE